MVNNFEPVELFAGDYPVMIDTYELASGSGTLAVGTALGMVTSTGKLKICQPTANGETADGTESIYAILADSVTLGEAAIKAKVYLTGCFNRDAITFGGTDTYSNHIVDARKVGIFFKSIAK